MIVRHYCYPPRKPSERISVTQSVVDSPIHLCGCYLVIFYVDGSDLMRFSCISCMEATYLTRMREAGPFVTSVRLALRLRGIEFLLNCFIELSWADSPRERGQRPVRNPAAFDRLAWRRLAWSAVGVRAGALAEGMRTGLVCGRRATEAGRAIIRFVCFFDVSRIPAPSDSVTT